LGDDTGLAPAPRPATESGPADGSARKATERAGRSAGRGVGGGCGRSGRRLSRPSPAFSIPLLIPHGHDIPPVPFLPPSVASTELAEPPAHGWPLADDALIRQVKEANDIVDVVGGYIALRPVGSTYLGL